MLIRDEVTASQKARSNQWNIKHFYFKRQIL